MQEILQHYRVLTQCIVYSLFILFLACTSLTAREFQQEINITGKITASEDGSALPGVNVVVKGTTSGTTTDAEGRFFITVPNENTILTFSFIGYNTYEMQVGNQTVLSVSLAPDVRTLNEVIVVGYGIQEKSVVTGAISSINGNKLKTFSLTRVDQALQGRAAGVQVISASGAPGAGMKVRIRGYSSNGTSDPLYIVDGVRTPDISYLDPNNISNIEVLKDAASAAIYGAEGGNGVVIVTTKTGKDSKGQVTYDVQYGVQTLARTPKVMNAHQFSTYMTEAGLLNNSPTDMNTNWIANVFESSPMQRHSLSFSGASEKRSFLLSLSYLSQDGVVKGDRDKFGRYSVMLNSDHQLNKWLKVGHNITFTHTKLNSVSENSEYGSVISNAMMLDPLTPVTYTGELPATVQALIDQGRKLLKDENGNYYGISQYLVSEIVNPFVARDASLASTQSNLLNGNLFAELSPLKGLTLRSTFGLNMNAANTHTYNQVYYYNPTVFNNLSSVRDVDNLGMFWQWENYVTYKKSIGDHNLTVLAGTTSIENTGRTVNAYGGPLTKDLESYADLSYLSNQDNSQVTGAATVSHRLSYFGRISYDYQKKYLLQASLRRDGASTDILPLQNRWGTFPSVSAGYVISQEKFFPKTFINSAKFRVSWGQNGSISNLGNYQYASSLISNGVYPITEGQLYVATRPAQLSNPELTWETSEQIDIGIDMGAFDDKLTLTVDYFNKKTKDLITTNTPPLETGNTASPVNAGNVLNKGFEFELGYHNHIGDLHYSFNANLATLRNEVTYLNPTITRLNGASLNLNVVTAFEKNKPIWYFRGYKTNGINPDTGDPVFVDTDGVPGITEGDKTYIGSAIPNLTFGGTLHLEYKGIDLNILGQGQSGNELLMALVRTDRPVINRLTLFYDDRWTQEKTDASMPRAGTSPNAWFSDLMIKSGNYLRIKQIQLGYRLPSSLLEKVKISSTRLYISLEDYFTFTNYPGVEVEGGSVNNNSIGVDRGAFPISKKLMFGASISF